MRRRDLREYSIWSAMKYRCYGVNANNYKFYGGRGIVVCDRWRNSFECFLDDMGLAPSALHSLDRIDTDGNYEPGNCKWATPREQSNNTRRNQVITYCGETKTLAEWSRDLGIGYNTLHNRIVNYGFSPEQAFIKMDYRGLYSGYRTRKRL